MAFSYVLYSDEGWKSAAIPFADKIAGIMKTSIIITKEVNSLMKNLKRMMALLMALMLLMGTALAENRIIFRGMTDEEEMANELLPEEEREPEMYVYGVYGMGDQAVIVMRNYETGLLSMYTWQEGQENMTLLADNLYRLSGYNSVEELAEYLTVSQENMPEGITLPDAEHVYSFLVGAENAIYGVNVTTGNIFTISGENGKAVYQDVTKMQDTSLFYMSVTEPDYSYRYAVTPEDQVIVGDYLLVRFEDWGSDGAAYWIACVNLKDGSVTKVNVEAPRKLMGYRDGKAVVMVNQNEADYDDEGNRLPWTALIYDPATDTTQTLVDKTTLIADYYTRQSIFYSPAKDMFFYLTNSLLYGTTDLKTSTTYAYTPLGDTENIAIVGDSMVTGVSRYGVMARTLVKDYSAEHTVYTLGYMPSRVSRKYGMDNPEIVVTELENISTSSTEEIASAFARGSDAPDLAHGYMNPTWSNEATGGWFLDTLNRRGYCMDLSVYPRVKEYVESLNPVFRDLVTDDEGHIFAMPVDVYGGSSFTINPDVYAEMGLTLEDIPTNLVELCEFITRWNNEFVEEYPNYAPIDSAEKYRERMFKLMLKEWIGYCQATEQELHFDDPIFREMMAALDKMEYDLIEKSNQTTNPEESDYKQPLIWTGTGVTDMYYNDQQTTFGQDNTPKLIQMTLTKDTKFVLSAGEVEVYYVNPRTTDQEQIGDLLGYILDEISPADATEMVAGATEPVENEYYAVNLEHWEAELAEYQRMYDEAAEEDKNDYKMMLDDYAASVELWKETDRYTVSPAYIQRYQEVILPALYIYKPSLFDTRDDTAGVQSLVSRYLDGQITLDQFIREADNKLWMIQMENQ